MIIGDYTVRSLIVLAVTIALIVLLYKSHILTALANGYEYKHEKTMKNGVESLLRGLARLLLMV